MLLFLSCLSVDIFDRGVSSNDFPCLENLCKKIIKEKQPFERLEIKKETLLHMFKVSEDWESPTKCNSVWARELNKHTSLSWQYNKFKCRILNEKVTTPTTTVYR